MSKQKALRGVLSGFDHGCGLSQVSARHLGRQGKSPEAIVARLYAGAKIDAATGRRY